MDRMGISGVQNPFASNFSRPSIERTSDLWFAELRGRWLEWAQSGRGREMCLDGGIITFRVGD